MSKQFLSTIIDYQNEPYQEIEVAVYQELVRQAQQTFNVHLFSVRAFIIVILIGCVVTFAGHPIEGIPMVVVGSGSTRLCQQLAKESQYKLERLLREVKYLQYS